MHGTVQRVARAARLSGSSRCASGCTRPTSMTVCGRGRDGGGGRRIKELEQENRELRRANEILQVGVGFLRGGARPPTEVIVALHRRAS